MTVCLDTDVLVDCLRGVTAAQSWLHSNSNEPMVVPGIAAMELLMGCQNQADLKRTRAFLDTFDVVWPEAHEFQRAFELLAEHRLASGLAIPDCLVAAMALERSLHLYTFNTKHYRVIAGLDLREPYPRTPK
ncbi:MAG: type II toxin-antitoxin system VapC family toxin [Chloroflexi bacterium]|nr:type II toxin-antitoxin system VapC family toxin [Chloroflexota bacterium]